MQTQFSEQYGIALRTGSLSNFNQDAQRGHEEMNAIGIFPYFTGTLVHDHWKPYYRYNCTHALCNAHHLRELTYAEEIDGQRWAKALRELLLDINSAIEKSESPLSSKRREEFVHRYRTLVHEVDVECLEPDKKDPHQRGRLKRSKSRNLLIRLRDYEADVLHFLSDPRVPFTNNQGERDIRMSKVQQKISGCFRSMEGAYVFCLIRSYLSTCRKQGVGAGDELDCLFNGIWPEFIREEFAGGE